jgi:hypothetical protein
MQYPALTMAIRRSATRLESDRNLAKKIKRLKRMLLVDSAEKPGLKKVRIAKCGVALVK